MSETTAPTVGQQRLVRWVDSEKHLPKWLRDFHDQKDVFKACERVLGRAGVSDLRPDGIPWTDGHIYTIDRFLRFMAYHGYTLRRTVSDAPEIADTLAECAKQRSEELRRALFPANVQTEARES
jgi:hypothetical protein